MSSLPKKRRLHDADEFTAVMRCRCRIKGDFLQVHAKPNDLGYSRLGLIVAKKIVRRAVMRNRIKRLLREVFRMNQQSLEANTMDWVVRLRQPIIKSQLAAMTHEAEMLMQRLQQCHE